MRRIRIILLVAGLVVLFGLVLVVLNADNVLGKPCPVGGCYTVSVSGEVSSHGKIVGTPTQVIFTNQIGQDFVASVKSSQGTLTYGPITLLNNAIYNVSVSSSESSCQAGVLKLISNDQALSWNANC